jgi:glycosyltransferase involved in cell wall biosynthesis
VRNIKVLHDWRMAEHQFSPNTAPLFSVIIPVYNDWAALDACLRSLVEQINPPGFEIVVVDDGSAEEPPESIRSWSGSYPLTIISQARTGTSVARNRGIQVCRGSVLLFIDADSRLHIDALARLYSAIMESPNESCFQLHLVGDRGTLVGKAEDLRLEAIQQHALQPDGRVRYLNTAGFAVRRSRVDLERGLFDARARRGEDTLLLANMIKTEELPFFVGQAIVRHAVPLSPIQSLGKEIRSALLESATYRRMQNMGFRIRASHWERMKMLFWMWKFSSQPSIGRSAWFFALARQIVRRIVSAAATHLNLGLGKTDDKINPMPSGVDSSSERC